jgi:hypothetical protein
LALGIDGRGVKCVVAIVGTACHKQEDNRQSYDRSEAQSHVLTDSTCCRPGKPKRRA